MNKLTIVKVRNINGDPVTTADLELARDTWEQSNGPAIVNGKLQTSCEDITGDDDKEIHLIKINPTNNGWNPIGDDLKAWGDVLADAIKDPDFKIFTHHQVEITKIPASSIIITGSDTRVIQR